MADLRLEDYNQRQHAHIDECAQQGTHELHPEGIGHNQQHINDNDGNEDVDRRSVADPTEYGEDNQRYNQYIYQIGERKAQKPEYCCRHNFF